VFKCIGVCRPRRDPCGGVEGWTDGRERWQQSLDRLDAYLRDLQQEEEQDDRDE
jgi:hypothetical protein